MASGTFYQYGSHEPQRVPSMTANVEPDPAKEPTLYLYVPPQFAQPAAAPQVVYFGMPQRISAAVPPVVLVTYMICPPLVYY